MGGGPTTSTSVTSSFPKWTQKAHQRLVGQAEEMAYGSDYSPYGAERIAGFNPMEQRAFGARENLYDAGDPWGQYTRDAMSKASGMSNQFAPIEFGYQEREHDFGTFGADQANQYMSPYMQNVVDQEKRAATQEFQRQGNRTAAEKITSGARGGYREALQNIFAGSEQARVQSDIQGRGSQRAFENAQQQFERDRGAAIQAARMGDASALEAARGRMSATAQTQGNLFKEAGLYSNLALQGSQLGGAEQQRELERIREMERSGATQREMDQSKMNLQYEDFQRQEEWPWMQMQRLSGIMAGVPSGLTQTNTSPGPNTLSQMLGFGVGTAGLAKLLQ